MSILLHQIQHMTKFDEVDVLFRLEGMRGKEGHDALLQVFGLANPKRHPVAVIHANHATTEMRLECVKHLDVAPMLNDGEFRQHLTPARISRCRLKPT